ncbi:type VI secretion system baseplate subunit TssG [Marivita geojedonensis]|uniref:Type VI secretion protein n=1 Tax=Marivita geojedonensis TaxID=1123756 RepID=A0A1X4NNA0_9RHOB|nr:type VI secretion system baseplate subunit TssG [Marivita geojedonensis]OSQ51927.1 type VI secretion protein [Marivita geojedonensis]PRY81339.1 type VI secretion system protein ImpH [Marivita geojedonensis]
MVTKDGDEPRDLTHFERLVRDPQSHHIFFAMRVLEAHFADQPRLGTARRPRQEKVRFGQEPELAFPKSTIHAFDPQTADQPARLRNLFFGLFGPHGPLPLHLTEYARGRKTNHKDTTFVAFADMLTHRPMELLYRAWVRGQPAPAFDRGENTETEKKIGALGGFFGDHLRDRDAMPDLAKRHFAGVLSAAPKNAEGLVAVIGGFFDAPVSLEEFVGAWLTLEPDDRWQLGGLGGLGTTACIGERVWSHSSKFRLRIGPLTLEEYKRFLPGTPALRRLRAIVRNYVGDQLDWDVNLVVRGEDVPQAQLGSTTQLGLTSWIGSEDHPAEVADLFMTPLTDVPLQDALAA